MLYCTYPMYPVAAATMRTTESGTPAPTELDASFAVSIINVEGKLNPNTADVGAPVCATAS